MGPGGEHKELLKALDARLAGKSVRQVAKLLFGAEAVADWDPDGGSRSKARRRIRKATGLMKGGYRKFLAGGANARGRR